MPKTLLLADDSVTIQKVVGISFANEDVKLVTVDNGDDALARAREIVPDIVLADVVMPGMNGYEVCEAIKADAALQHVPVLLLTGTFEAYDEERARRAGADGHVTKPFEAQALVDLVNARLAQAAAPAAAAAPVPETAAAPDGDVDLFDEVTAPSDVKTAAAPTPEPEADADADDRTAALLEEAPGGLGVDEEPRDFAFEAPDEVHDELSVTRAPAAPAAPAETSHDATVALFDDDDDAFANAETLPPVDAGAEEAEADPFAATRVVEEPEPSVAGGAEEPEEPVADWFDEPVTAPPAGGEPFAAVGPDELSGDDGLGTPEAARDYDVSSSDLGDPFAEPAAPEPAAPVETAPPASAEPFASDEAPERSAAGVSPELSPVFRAQIRDAVEKVAWEAFGDLAEKLVKDTVDRVERVAWEVVPQMAETLIQEEIRRLKGDEE